MQTILITGGTGLVGKCLTTLLLKNGYKVIVLSRRQSNPENTGSHLSFATWDVGKKQIDIAALQQADYIIHLAGAGVMDKKWTTNYKNEIVNSRVDSATLIAENLKQHTNKVKAIISASAIGWYNAAPIIHEENEQADESFLGHTCRLWEESIAPVSQLNKRLVKLRIGIVLSNNGGALKEFITPIKLGVAAILGNGKQIISWIHIDDLCRLFLFAIENDNLHGVYNAVAPSPTTNKILTLTLAKKMRKIFYVPLHVPVFILKIMLGSRSIEILKSNAVSCKKIIAAGFSFLYPDIETAMKALTNKTSYTNAK